MQIPKYHNFDCLPSSLKDYIWVIFSPDNFLDLIYRLCPEELLAGGLQGEAVGLSSPCRGAMEGPYRV